MYKRETYNCIEFSDELFDKEYGSLISFDEGELFFSGYSYEIDSFGHLDLNKDETKELYLKMKEYYERQEV